MELSADARSLGPDSGRTLISELVSVFAHRKPLPEPDGLIGTSGNPIPGSADEARARVSAINATVQTSDAQLVDVLTRKSSAAQIMQEPGAQLPDASSLCNNLPPQQVADPIPGVGMER